LQIRENEIEMKEDCIQIGLIDRNTLHRETLVYALTSQPDFRVAFSAASVNEVPAYGPPPHVMLFSAWYPSEVFGEELSMVYWRIRMPQTRLVLLTANTIRAVIEVLADQAIDGFMIRQTVNTQTMFDIVRSAARGKQAFCPTTQAILAGPKTEKDLTRREVQIIHRLHDVGIGNRKQVAHTLGVSTFTVNQHLKNIFEKLGVSGVAEVMERGRAMGILEPTVT